MKLVSVLVSLSSIAVSLRTSSLTCVRTDVVLLYSLSAAYSLNLLDLIIVLKEGNIVEQGTHEELMLEKGLYYRMWLQQASSEGASNGG